MEEDAMKKFALLPVFMLLAFGAVLTTGCEQQGYQQGAQQQPQEQAGFQEQGGTTQQSPEAGAGQTS